MTFRKYDAGALARPKGAPKKDCQVRALATARSIPYDEAWELLYRVQGEFRRCGFALVESVSAGDTRFGVIRTVAFPAARGKPRLTGAEFCKRYPKGRFVLHGESRRRRKGRPHLRHVELELEVRLRVGEVTQADRKPE